MFVVALLFIVGFCLFLSAFIEDIEDGLSQLNKCLKKEKVTSLTIVKQIETRKSFSEIIQFHSEVKELSFYSSSFL